MRALLVALSALTLIAQDRRVSFQVKLPTAQRVEVMPGGGANGLGKGPFPMTRSAEGIWATTIGPVQPGFHYYWFLVDGVPVNDPAADSFYGWGRHVSGVDVPARPKSISCACSFSSTIMFAGFTSR